jgi:hypothetical protein
MYAETFSPLGAFHLEFEIPPGIDAVPFGAIFVVPLSFFQLSWVAILRTTY